MKRIFVWKKNGFNTESKSLKESIKKNLGIKIDSLKVVNIYDIENLAEEKMEIAIRGVLSEPNVDNVSFEMPTASNMFATQLLPVQFDNRSDAAEKCIKLIYPEATPKISTGKLYLLDDGLKTEDISMIKKSLINKIEMREMKLEEFGKEIFVNDSSVKYLEGFNNLDFAGISSFLKENGLAMNVEDLIHIQKYFKDSEKREPTETEIMMLDTYWSDHCRHTTFETEIKKVDILKSPLSDDIEKSYITFKKSLEKLSPEKPITLMNLATINFKELKNKGQYQDVEISSEINACSIFADVNVNGAKVKYSIQFKNETHNHPTEIEPFGGASTCLGGAIRDPLSGRAYVYQSMRVSGSGNPIEKIEDTIPNKLPQRVISKSAANGFSSYGNQIGIAATLVEEIIHPGFKAKRLEAGAVVAAAPADHIIREEPKCGDLIIMIGGATGRDGIGGATGSSKGHSDKSSESSSEVQKGNPPEERKLQRIFSNKEFTRLVKKSNDFGAGGVSVAVGELAESLEINLDEIELKYKGLNGHEIALSESQERMAIVVNKEDVDKVMQLAHSENLVAKVIAVVTSSGRLVMKWKGETIVDISREFINSNGVRQKVNATISYQEKYERAVEGKDFEEKFKNNFKDINVSSQKGLVQNFDNTIGNTTVLNPYGGKTQLTKAHVSVQKVPMRGADFTDTVTMMSSAYNPSVTSSSPFLGGNYAIVASISKIVAYGGNMKSLKFSLQEFFEKLEKDPLKWGEPLAALLGASNALREFNHAAIGGKDSMSGTFNDIKVPPTLISFAVSIAESDNIISSEFKKSGNNIYVLKHNPKENGMPNFEELINNYQQLEKLIKKKIVISAWPLVKGGISEALVQMAQGNDFGFEVDTDFDLFDFNYGTIVVESPIELESTIFTKIGVINEGEYRINSHEFSKKEIQEIWENPLEELFPTTIKGGESFEYNTSEVSKSFAPLKIKETPHVVIPVFTGTNCEYDIERKFAREGATTKQVVFLSLNEEDIRRSIKKLAYEISKADILAIPGGFSAGDEPDGSGKYIANILRTKEVKQAIDSLISRKGLIIGICNGFQALIKSGLLPYGEVMEIKENDPTLFRNDINEHVSKYVRTKVSSDNSPWLKGFKIDEVHTLPVSHGEGKFIANEEWIKRLKDNNQIAFQYVDNNNEPTEDGRFNPNGSVFAIEGITSKDGLILGKMSHSERYEKDIAKNIYGNKDQNIFKNAIRYFKGDFK